jgi:hypothetical protein
LEAHPVLQLALAAIVATALSVVIAYLLIRRRNVLLGLVLGLLPIAIMEFAYNWSLDSSIHRCIASACASAGLPPDCTIAEFGCTEWSGMSRFLFFAAGVLSLGVYSVGAGTIAILHHRNLPKLPPDTHGSDAAA